MEIGHFNPLQNVAPRALSSGNEQDAENQKQQEEEPLENPASPESRELQQLKAIDRRVRAHEQAHLAVGGQYTAGGADFEYRKGPDGQSYAVGGEVSIDTSKVAGDPEATIRKMQIVQQAALAPADPSAQDRRVAAQASRAIAEARLEIAQERLAPEEDSADGTTQVSSPVSQSLRAYSEAASAAENTQQEMLNTTA